MMIRLALALALATLCALMTAAVLLAGNGLAELAGRLAGQVP